MIGARFMMLIAPTVPGWRPALADTSPANFGMVMATGIVSIAARMLGLRALALALFALNLGLYALLWVLYLARLALLRQRFLDEKAGPLARPGKPGASCVREDEWPGLKPHCLKGGVQLVDPVVQFLI